MHVDTDLLRARVTAQALAVQELVRSSRECRARARQTLEEVRRRSWVNRRRVRDEQPG